MAVLSSRWLRVGFLVLALVLAVVAVVVRREAVAQALGQIGPGAVLGAVGLGVLWVVLTLLAWRAVLTDLGSPLPLRAAAPVFLVSQLGKYVPGGVWNVVAAAELGAEHKVPRRRSLSAMAVSVLVAIVTGLLVAVVAVSLAPAPVRVSYGWVLWVTPALVVVLVPPVLNRVLALALRIARRPALEHELSARGLGACVAWSLAGWVVAGAQVSLLAVAAGMEPNGQTLALASGGYALAWVVGFLVVVVPAGLGAREVVLGAVLAGQLSPGGVIAVVLLSRVALTVADVLLGLLGLAVARRSARGSAPLPR
jgi:hypothetical protein